MSMSINPATAIFAGLNFIVLLSIIVGAILLVVCLLRRNRGGVKCLSCGKRIPQDANMCPYCGQKR